MTNVDNELDDLMSHLGDFGKYQARQFALHIIAALTAGLHMMTLLTVAAVPQHRCVIPGLDVINGEPTGVSFENGTGALEELPRASGSCSYITAENETLTCDTWVYDTTYFQSSRGIEWNFVCTRRWMGAVAQSAYMFGVFVGAVTLGTMADKYGRKKIFYISSVAQLILGVIVAFIPEYYTFLFVRFLYGVFGSAGAYITGFVLTMELVGPTKRTICGVMFQLAFAVGFMLVAAWGAVINDRMWLQIIYGLHSALLVGHWWFMDESPRWLWAQGRVREAIKIIKKGLLINGSNIEVDVARYVSRSKIREADDRDRQFGALDLFRTPNLRKKSLNVCLNWFANSIVYYGLSLNSGNLVGNPFLTMFLMGLVELPSYFLTSYLMDRTGRRSLISAYMLIGGVCSICATSIPQQYYGASVATISIVMLGKACIASSFAIIYNYTAELFPTVLRNTALGIGSMCARLSGALTPMIMLLDTFDPKVPATLFGFIAILAGFLALYLPETLNQPMPETLEDGENFGKGDTCFASCYARGNRRNKKVNNIVMVPVPDKEDDKGDCT
ncbi:organic cation transporter protein [Cephus cinctus]|uniref:Organic cation transporter protein n=1 Tax=Cephus cinctus TaxID=211228 RepID=A0AAJ7C8S3_CEPCN|nr:organic cation transporter protein [Cephus cinctus]XP_024945337.1 organic cation transporter protein [Cephus cinctus]